MDKNKKLSKLFMILVSIQTILMGIVFIVQLLRIYYGNNHIYTSEICGKYVLQILPVILIWIALIITSYVYHRLSNSRDDRPSKMTNTAKLKLFEYQCPVCDEDNELKIALNKEKNKRKIVWIINIVIIVLCSLMGLLYLINVKHFDSQGNFSEQAIQMTIHLLPWVIISFISLIMCLLFEEASAAKSIEIIKAIIKTEGKKSENYTKVLNEDKKIMIIRLSIIVIAVVLIIHGIINGGAADVLQKAINICTECIGLG